MLEDTRLTSPLIGLCELPDEVVALFEASSADEFFLSLSWFRTLASAGFDAAGQTRVYLAGPPEARAGLVLCATPPAFKGYGTRTARSLTNFYSCRYGPLLRDEARPQALESVIDQLVGERPRWDVINLDSLDHDGALFPALMQTFASRGWPVQSYFHFGNWFESTTAMTAADYLAARPGQLRNTLKRRANKLAKTAPFTFKLYTRGDEIEDAIALYETIYAHSWKDAEPFPSFAAELIRTIAALGSLRLGIMTIDGVPAAAQIWIVWHGKATIFKLAHDKRFTALSPGSLLTSHMMEQVLSEGGIREVDFGRGDDPYKALWLPRRRERWGIIAFNPSTLRGRAAALRHLGPATLRQALSRITSRFRAGA